MGQFLAGFASRIFIDVARCRRSPPRSTPSIVGISWALIAYQLAGIQSCRSCSGRLGDVHGRYAIYGGGFAVAGGEAPSLRPRAKSVLALLITVQGRAGASAQPCSHASAARVAGDQGRCRRRLGGSDERVRRRLAFHSGPSAPGRPSAGVLIDLVGWRWVFFLLIPTRFGRGPR